MPVFGDIVHYAVFAEMGFLSAPTFPSAVEGLYMILVTARFVGGIDQPSRSSRAIDFADPARADLRADFVVPQSAPAPILEMIR